MTIITALWGRPVVTRAFLEHWNAISGVHLVAAVDPEDPGEPEPVGRWRFVEASNPRSKTIYIEGDSSVSDRFQACLDGVRDDVMIVGSDDFADQEFVDRAQELLSDWQLVQPYDIYMSDGSSTFYCQGWNTGAGRTFRRDLLRKMGWRLWDKPVNRGLDRACFERTYRMVDTAFAYLHREQGTTMCDFKTGENMWDFSHTLQLVPLTAMLPEQHHEALMRWLPESLSTLPPSGGGSETSGALSAT